MHYESPGEGSQFQPTLRRMILKNKQKALLLLITLIQMMMTRSFTINYIVFFYCNSIAPFEMTDPLDILLDGRLPARPFAKEKGTVILAVIKGCKASAFACHYWGLDSKREGWWIQLFCLQRVARLVSQYKCLKSDQ